MAIQQLTQPIVNPIAAFDSTKEHEITFIVIGGAQVTGNRVVITNNKTGNVVYEKITATMKLAVTIPANTLSNNNYYNVVIYTIDNANNQSNPSTPVPFYCYSQPTLTITNIPATETIGNGTYAFQGNYLQSEGEQLNSYQFILYDSNKNILDRSDIIYYQSNSSLAYTFVGMDNDTSYYVELKGQTVNNTEITSGLMYFTVRYTQPATFAIVDLINDCENGYIQISSNIVAIDGKSNPEPPIYIDDKEVDLRDKDSWVKWDEGFNINNDFTMRIWGRDFNDYERIISLANKENTPDNPNKIEMKWMIADVIETLPSYTSVSGKNVAIKNGFKTDIEDLEVMGNSEQISKAPVDLGTGNYIKAETTRDMYLDIQVQGNQYQKTQEGSKQSASGTEVYLTGVDSSKPADIVVNGNNYQETREGYNLLNNTLQSQTINGLKVTVNKDKSVTVVGTATANTNIVFDVHNKTIEAGTYTLKDCRTFIESTENKGWWNVGETRTFTNTATLTDKGFFMFYSSGTVVNETLYPMLIKGSELKPYEQYGASPSPDYPSEIQTVGSNVNLFDKDRQDMFLKGLIPNNSGGIQAGTTDTSASNYLVTIIVPCLPNLTYIISRYAEGKTFFVYESSKKDLKVGDNVTFLKRNDNTGVINEKITTGANAKYLLVKIYNTYAIEPNTYNDLISSVKVEKGSIATPYSPYGMGSVGINIANKNLLYYTNENQTIKGIDYTINQDKSIKVKGTATEYSDFYLCGTANQYEDIGLVGTFKISGCNSGKSSKYMLYVVKKDKFGKLEYYQNVAGNTKLRILEGDTLRIFIRVLTGITVDDVIYPMLRVFTDTDNSYIEAKKQTAIMPVQQEMLTGDYIKDVEHHEWGKYIFTGDEDYNKSSTYSNEKYFCGYIPTPVVGDIKIDGRGLCNYFGKFGNYDVIVDEECIRITGQFQVRILASRLTENSAEALKAWLKSKYDEGNPVVVYYQLATPTDLVLTDIQKTAQAQLTNMTIYQDITNITNESSYPAILNVDYNITRAMPSPEAPSEVKVVGNNINLYNKDTMIELDGQYRTSVTGNITTNIDFYGLKIPVRPNTQYVTSSNIDYSLWSNLCYFDSNMSFIKGVAYNLQNKVFTTPDNCSFVTIALNKTYDWFKLEQGSVVTTYSPYNQGSVQVNVQNKNIMPISSLGTNWEYTDKGIRNNTNSNGKELFSFNIKNGQKINIGLNLISKPQVDTTFTIYVDGTPKIIGSFGSIENYELNQIYQREYTATKDCNISCRMYGNVNKDIFEFQMWAGYDNLTEYTRYEEQSYIMPVQKPMLTGDYISDIEHSGWEKIVIDNTAPLVTEPTQKSGSPRYSIVLSNFIGKNFKNSSTSNEAIAYSNMFPLIQKGATFQLRQGFTIADSKIYIYDEGESLDAFKQLLADNPLIVYAQLATPENLPLTTEQQTIQSTLKPAYADITNIYATEDLPILKASTLRVPSPSVPSPIYSSGDQRNLLEDLGLFDISYTQDYFKVTDTIFKLKPNFVYNLSFDYTINNASTDLYFTVCYKNGNNITDITGAVLYYNQATGRSNTSFMVPEDIPNNSTLSVKFVRTLIPANVNVSISNVQLEKGRVAHDYQKHGLYNIYPTATQKNIFDYDKIYYVENKNTEISYIQNGISANLAGTNETAYIAIGFPNILQPGQNYAISYNSYGELLSSKLYTMNKETGERIEEITLDNGSFTAPSNVYDFLFEFTLNDTIENNQVQIWNIQIETGDQVTEYEVYKPNQTTITLDQPLRAIGNYKDIICLESPNLLNPQTQIANVKGGQDYYFSQSGNTQYQLNYLTEYGNLISSVNMASGRITAPDTCVQIRVNASSSDITSNKLQINEGATAEIYYPYVSEPSVIRYIEELELDGGISDDASYAKSRVTTDIDRFTISPNALAPNTISGTVISLSNYFYFYNYGSKKVPSFYTDRAGSKARPFRIVVNYTTQGTTLADFKSWVNSKYKEGNPLIFYHIINNPIVEALSLENVSALNGLKTYEGTSNVFTNNNMPANINFSYISGQSEQEAKNAYITLKCWNGNVMPYFVHSNYIDIPKETDKVFIWVRKKNNIFDLKIENLGDYQGEET